MLVIVNVIVIAIVNQERSRIKKDEQLSDESPEISIPVRLSDQGAASFHR